LTESSFDVLIQVFYNIAELPQRKLQKKPISPYGYRLFSFLSISFLISASIPIDQVSVVDGAAGSEGLWFLFFLHIDILDTAHFALSGHLFWSLFGQ